VQDPNHSGAFNNYGNVLREMGHTQRAIPFLETARLLDPSSVTAEFNLAVAHLMLGNYEQGWKLYESRWRYEHLDGTKPRLPSPEWSGEDLRDKTILVIGEQGLGDQIQFLRFCGNLQDQGAKIRLHVSPAIKPLLINTPEAIVGITCNTEDEIGAFDYWVAMMSLPRLLNMRLEHVQHYLQYVKPDAERVKIWSERLGVTKNRMRIGIAWSGRKDSWINQHKSIPVETMAVLVKKFPEHQWVNLQVDASPEDEAVIKAAGVECYPGTINDFADTAALMHHLDLVISVDTAAAHLAGAMGRPVWIPLNSYGACWRWMQNRDDSPWYTTARLFRQEKYGDWSAPMARIEKFLGWFKI
jgi:ADP-heptose:LPS heptosyltransferase